MSRNGHDGVPGAVFIGDFALSGGEWFPSHRHSVHQLVWSRRGVGSVRIGDATWFLPRTLALWVPAGVVHATGAVDPSWNRSPYFRPERCPAGIREWAEPTVVAVSPLLAALIDHLADEHLTTDERIRAEAVVFDQLRPLSTVAIPLPMPRDRRAARIAAALVEDPADDHTLAQWASEVGASARTLRRVFLAETGLSFGRWRTHVRLRAAMPVLAAGQPVAAAARRAGYGTPSAFVAAFHRTVGVPPGVYFARG
ncbi:AraC family transcriptional regulator [Cryptosporangium aurantiacum]|uniref:HTH-type transcriptional regulator RipA n=1 Tax=Cryptosporangium aurantiacum TaxID=134849 RepID=A0A1M7RIX7_9ACTN|nr:helix-turn-helix transcriptional regulator [Cryptosporangium aurantiacum]SHN46247.1 AraC-type DNA-binding protein [Cryptosporangium aurantiacum]